MHQAASATVRDTRSFRVFLDLPTLLQHKALQRHSGRLRVYGPEGRKIDFFLEDGAVVHGRFDDRPIECFEEALAEIFEWHDWQPEFDESLRAPIDAEDKKSDSMARLVLSAMARSDEEGREDGGPDASEAPGTDSSQVSGTEVNQAPGTEASGSAPGEVDSAGETGELRRALGLMLRQPEVRAWLVCDEHAEISSSGGFEN
ncbi:MAG: DUF4388 domain-containing protein, partial [Acidobacteriota bacterium]